VTANMHSKQGLLLIVAGLGVLVWVLVDPAFQDRRYLAIPAGISLLVLATAWLKNMIAFGGWVSLAVLGQAVALQLIVAGPYMRYQHFKELKGVVSDTQPFLLALLTLQIVLVSTGLITRRGTLLSSLKRHFRLRELVFLAVVAFLTGATVSERVDRYLTELLFAASIQAVNLGNLVLVALSIPSGWADQLSARYGGRLRQFVGRPALDRSVVLAAIGTVILSAVLSVFSYQRHPHIPDEVAYVQHASFFASGRLTAPAPRVHEAFDVYLMKFDGNRWYPSPPPGWSAVLALGTAVGLPWLVNPLLAGLNVLLTFFLLRKLYDARTARLAVFLLCLSPWFIFMGMNFMTHMATLTCALLAGLSIMKARTSGKWAWAAASGAFIGFTSLIRPLDGLILGILVALGIIGSGWRRLSIRQFAVFGLGAILVGGLNFPYNYYLTGNPLRFPIMQYTDERFGPGSNAFGFGPDRGMGWPIDPFPGHGPIDALVNANLNTFSVNIELFGWSIGSLFLVALFLVRARWQKNDLLMMAVIATIFAAHFFYYFSGGPDFGARYWFLIIVPCVVLSVRGLQLVAGNAKEPGAGWTRPVILVSLLGLCALVNYVPWRAADKYYHYLNMRPDIRELAEQHRFGRSLVLIQGDEQPDYASAAAYNPIDVNGADGPIYAWDRAPGTTSRLLEAYPDRPVWIFRGPTLTKRSYDLVAGPLPARAAQVARERRSP